MTGRPLVSADLDAYAEGGFYEGPERLAALRAEARPSEILAELFPRYSYRRPVPAGMIQGAPEVVAAREARDRALEADFRVGARSSLVRLGPCRILDRAIYLETDRGLAGLYETQRDCDRPYLTHSDPEGTATERLPPSHDYLFLGSVGSFNYGHWLVDDLSRHPAIAAAAAAAARPLCLLLAGHGPYMDEVRRGTIDAVAGGMAGVPIRFLAADRAYAAETLLYPTPTSRHPVLKSPAALDALAEAARAFAVAADARPSRRPPARVYLHRRAEHGRVPADEAALVAALQRRRFFVVDPEGATLAQLFGLLLEARLVVGVMGAAMTNTLVCRPGTRVLHLAPDSFDDPFYWDLAAVRGHRYMEIACPPAAADPTRFDLDPHRLADALDALEV
ncbi:MAG: glycosyltransferase family 61 protein [Methylobacteriaceae bacterium]|nr:glycosyltransferase family 61 protein [Methylobacteriaceae bacterium]